jgi:hypothetical protein
MTGIAKAWVNFNGSTATINGSFNISSITKNGTGDYFANFTTAMPNTTYAVACGSTSTTRSDIGFAYPSTTARFGVFGAYTALGWPSSARDIDPITAIVFSS